MSSGLLATANAPSVRNQNYKHGLNNEMSDIREMKKQKKKMKLKLWIHYALWHGSRPLGKNKKGGRKWEKLAQDRSQMSMLRETDNPVLVEGLQQCRVHLHLLNHLWSVCIRNVSCTFSVKGAKILEIYCQNPKAVSQQMHLISNTSAINLTFN